MTICLQRVILLYFFYHYLYNTICIIDVALRRGIFTLFYEKSYFCFVGADSIRSLLLSKMRDCKYFYCDEKKRCKNEREVK